VYEIITLGSASLDAFAKTHSQIVTARTKHHHKEALICYPLGTKLLLEDVTFHVGGGGTNTAASFSQLGLRTGYLGNLGSDHTAHQVLHDLKQRKVTFLGTRDRSKTNYSIILDTSGDRTILVYKGSSHNLKWKNVQKNKLRTKWFYSSSLLLQSFTTLKHIAKYAKQKKIKLAFNPSSYQAKRGAKYLAPVLKYTTALILNREEVGLLLRKDKQTNIKTLLSTLHHLGPELVVITDGKKGAYASSSKEKAMYHVYPKGVKVKEATGAGDCFASTFIASLIKKKSVPEALQLAQCHAESCIQHTGAKEGLLSWGNLLKRKKSWKVKVKKV
jgi:ribokinase